MFHGNGDQEPWLNHAGCERFLTISSRLKAGFTVTWLNHAGSKAFCNSRFPMFHVLLQNFWLNQAVFWPIRYSNYDTPASKVSECAYISKSNPTVSLLLQLAPGTPGTRAITGLEAVTVKKSSRFYCYEIDLAWLNHAILQ